MSAFDGLPPEYRRALELAFVDGIIAALDDAAGVRPYDLPERESTIALNDRHEPAQRREPQEVEALAARIAAR